MEWASREQALCAEHDIAMEEATEAHRWELSRLAEELESAEKSLSQQSADVATLRDSVTLRDEVRAEDGTQAAL